MNLEFIKEGDIFSTETKLLSKVGFKKSINSKQKKYQIKELNRYLSYEKTGKVSRGKVTNEIVITEIYNEPLEKEDGRSDGNNSSILSDSIYDYIIDYIDCEPYIIEGSKSSLIKQMGFMDSEFNNALYNFDDVMFRHTENGEEEYTDVEKDFFFDYCDMVMNSYKSRLNRVLDKLGDAIVVKKFYQVSVRQYSKKGEEYFDLETIRDAETISKINQVREHLEFIYGVMQESDKWKIFVNRNAAKKFYDDFAKQVGTLLKNEAIASCYEILSISRNKDSDIELVSKGSEQFPEKLNQAQMRLADDKIESVFKKTKSIYREQDMEWIKVLKYQREDISNEMINDCKNMVNRNLGMIVDEDTGEVSFLPEVLERHSA